jgi:hypothetical protein
MMVKCTNKNVKEEWEMRIMKDNKRNKWKKKQKWMSEWKKQMERIIRDENNEKGTIKMRWSNNKRHREKETNNGNNGKQM